MNIPSFLRIAVFAAMQCAAFAAVTPQVAELSFDKRFEKAGAIPDTEVPAWVAGVEQQGGAFLDEPKCWHVAATGKEGAGRLAIALDRKRINENLVATVLFDADDSADIAIQLFDGQGRAVVLDLFGNLVDVGRDATTNTFVIPLVKYPSAEKIVIRRIRGDVKVYGIVLYPVVTEGTPVKEALTELARVLGDPLSPENPLLKGLQQIAKSGSVAINPVHPPTPKAESEKNADAKPRGKYAAARAPAPGVAILPPPTDGLMGWWNFAGGTATDASGKNHNGVIRGGVQFVDGLHGRAIKLRKNPSAARAVSWDSVTMPATPDLSLADSLTVSAWIKYSTIAPNWGSQIVWFGDEQYGRDPYVLHLWSDGTLELRSDRSVTGRPVFTVFEDEIKLSPKGVPMMNQHVGVWSPNTLAPETWYFVAGTIEKLAPQKTMLRLFVNGENVGEEITPEVVNYPTDKMWMTIGAVDLGTWQNFDGLIEDVRVYNRPLAPAEIKALYNQPWQTGK